MDIKDLLAAAALGEPGLSCGPIQVGADGAVVLAAAGPVPCIARAQAVLALARLVPELLVQIEALTAAAAAKAAQ